MTAIIYVGLGGALGSVSRFLLTNWVQSLGTISARFPVGTLLVNVVGSCLIGLLVGIFSNGAFSDRERFLWISGFLGGFTTYSAFSFETFTLLKEQSWLLALLNMLAHLVLGLVAVALGFFIARKF